jgi:hypothetical protein
VGQSSEYVSLYHLTCHISTPLGQYTFWKRLLKIQQEHASQFLHRHFKNQNLYDFLYLLYKYKSDLAIDIAWGGFSYTSSTCAVMYCRQRPHLLYIMVVKVWNTILFVPLHRMQFQFTGGQRCRPTIRKEHSLYKAEKNHT